jgi:predicted nucleotidyltransferase
MNQDFGLHPQTIDKLLSIFKMHSKIECAILYGSRATGKHKKTSDIDITLMAPSMDLSEYLKIENEIDDLLLPYKVDLSLFHLLNNQELKDHICNFGVKIYNSKSE